MIDIELLKNGSFTFNKDLNIKEYNLANKKFFFFYKSHNLNFINFRDIEIQSKNLSDIEIVKKSFRNNSFLDCVLIYNFEIISIFLSTSASQVNIFKENNNIILTQKEFFHRKDINKSRFNYRIFTNHSINFLPGINEKIVDIILPGFGMDFKFSKNTFQKIKDHFLFNLDKISSNQNHEKIAENIAHKFVKNLKQFKGMKNLKLMQSSGIDSNLILASAKEAMIDVEPINVTSNPFKNEYLGAKRIADYLKFNTIKIGSEIKNPNIFFDAHMNIEEYLNYSKKLISNFSGHFYFNHIGLSMCFNFKNSHFLEGSAYPTSLCYAHLISYPRSLSTGFFKFDNTKNFKLREKFTGNSNTDLFNLNDLSQDLKKFMTNIHPKYQNALHTIFFGSQRVNLFEKILTKSSLFSLHSNDLDKMIIKRGVFILDRLKAIGLINHLQNFSSETYQKILKLAVFINNIGWTATRNEHFEFSGLSKISNPGLSFDLIEEFLETKIDEKMVNYPKWHLFKAFEILAGKSFFEIKTFNSINQILKNRVKIMCSNSEKRNYDIRRDIFKNKNVQSFVNQELNFNKNPILENLNNEYKIDDWKRYFFSENANINEFWVKNNIIALSSLTKSTI